MLSKIKRMLQTDNGVVLIGNLLASAFGLGTFMLLARVLTKSDFGAWALFIAAAGLLDLMRTGMVRQGMVRALSIEKDDNQKQSILATSGIMALVISLGAAVLVGLIEIAADSSEWSLHIFFVYYPVFVMITLPSNFDTWKSHAEGNFKRMNGLRLFSNIIFILFVAFGFFYKFTFSQYLWAYLTSQGLVSAYSLISLLKIHWAAFSMPRFFKLVAFGKHSLATLAGSNLLKSSDSLLIGAFLGNEAVAVYAIPLKALDLLDIPLRGFAMTSYRTLSNYFEDKNQIAFSNHIWSHVKKLTLFFLPGVILLAIFPELAIRVLGGAGYQESSTILMILTIPMLLMPLEKYLGMSFDSIDQPKWNALKVWLMVGLNIAGDIVVLYFFQSLTMVAVVTITNITLGIVFSLTNHPYLLMGKKLQAV